MKEIRPSAPTDNPLAYVNNLMPENEKAREAKIRILNAVKPKSRKQKK